jgi:hypothetical protein
MSVPARTCITCSYYCNRECLAHSIYLLRAPQNKFRQEIRAPYSISCDGYSLKPGWTEGDDELEMLDDLYADGSED